MPEVRLIGATGAGFMVVLLAAWSPALAQSARGSMPPAEQRGIVDSYKGFIAALQRGTTKFEPLLGKTGQPADGWPLFKHGKITIKAGAPAPTVPFKGAEWGQWAKDIATWNLEEVKDRKVLYGYYLTNKAGADVAEKVFEAVAKASSEGAALAIGVEYEAKGLKASGLTELYRRAAVPLKWTEMSSELIKSEHSPEAFAALVTASGATAYPGAYANFQAVKKWSALGKAEKSMKEKHAPDQTLAFPAITAGIAKGAKGPIAWSFLEPSAAFIVLDRQLEIEGVETMRMLTSKTAWPGKG